MLSWYYSILDELDDYQESTGSSLSADVEFLIQTSTDIRHAISGGRSDFDSYVIERGWQEYDAIVESSISLVLVPAYGLTAHPALAPFRPVVKAGGTIARWTANAMKYGMQITGYDERIVRDFKEQHHITKY